MYFVKHANFLWHISYRVQQIFTRTSSTVGLDQPTTDCFWNARIRLFFQICLLICPVFTIYCLLIAVLSGRFYFDCLRCIDMISLVTVGNFLRNKCFNTTRLCIYKYIGMIVHWLLIDHRAIRRKQRHQRDMRRLISRSK